MRNFLAQILAFLEEVFAHKSNDNPAIPATINEVTPMPPEPIDTLHAWDTPDNCRHNVRVICDLEGLTVVQKDDLSRTVNCESNYKPNLTVHNCFKNGVITSVRAEIYNPAIHGKIQTTDFGIAQINDYWHIGPGKTFPSSEYVLNNPAACIRWMCQQFKAGHANAWVCHLRNMQVHYTA